MSEELFKQMAQAVIDGDPDQAQALAQKALDSGVDPLEAINRGYTPGMDVVGELYSSGEYFLPDLILGGEAMKAALAVLPQIAEMSTWSQQAVWRDVPAETERLLKLFPSRPIATGSARDVS